MGTIQMIRELIADGLANDEILEAMADAECCEPIEREDEFYMSSPVYGGTGDCIRNDAGEWMGA